jgi:hypothetical protein
MGIFTFLDLRRALLRPWTFSYFVSFRAASVATSAFDSGSLFRREIVACDVVTAVVEFAISCTAAADFEYMITAAFILDEGVNAIE